jgi:hypothetical protein
MAGIAMPALDDYVTDVLMRDLVGHDRRPVSFLVYLWLAAEAGRRGGEVQISYRELAESVGVSKSSVQAAVSWLKRRKLLSASKENATATPRYTVLNPWREAGRRAGGRGPRNTMTKAPPNILDLPLEDRALMALKAAVEKVIEEHIREGLPLYIWRDGKVVAVPAEELRAERRRMK